MSRHAMLPPKIKDLEDEAARLALVGENYTDTKPNRFEDALLELANLHNLKNRDYGSSTDPYANVRASQEFGIAPWLGAIIRANDKVTRLKTFATKGELANESVEDSLRDLAVYAVIALVLYREQP